MRKKKTIPLILRANAGDWIEITLHNLFDKPVLYHDYPSVPLDMPHKPSDRVSLSLQFLKRCPVCSAGVNAGFNKCEQTASPGECIRYLWYADKEYGTCMLSSFGDMRNHRYHGLFGAIIIEPPAAKYYSRFSFKRGIFNEQAVIFAPGVKTFREFVLFVHNGIRMLDKYGNLIKTSEQGEDPLLIEHILREAKLYYKYVQMLEDEGEICRQSMKEIECFWNQIMMEHALFIRGLFDPSETELINSADMFAKDYSDLLSRCHNAQNRTLNADSMAETKKFRDFKTAGVEGIEGCRIRSLILPLLADHVLREANHFIRILEN